VPGYNPRSGTSPTLAKSTVPAISFNPFKGGSEKSSLGFTSGHTDCIRAQGKAPFAIYVNNSSVRYLTVVECERLQGFDDDYTKVKYFGKSSPNSLRYESVGNSMAVNAMRWIGTRIDIMEGLIQSGQISPAGAHCAARASARRGLFRAPSGGRPGREDRTMTNPAIDLFVEEAKAVSVTDAAMALGLVKQTNKNHAGPCPKCGGNDRFSISPVRQAWNCRGCGIGGRDGISLFAHVNGHNLRSRSGFLAACSEALGGRPIPDGGERETEAERAGRLARIEAQKAVNAEQAASQQKTENIWREREVEKARGLYLKAPERPVSAILGEYLRRRTGFAMHEGVFANLRLQPNATYWHGKDDRGHEIAFHAGPAMIAPFVNLDGRITGCHQTWIDLRNPPKFRAELRDDAGEPLTAKKMRGTKKGSLIPLFGLMSAARWVGGEGIENGLTIAGAEGFRLDTFYFAAGDLGNLAGPADPKSAFSHPHEVKRTRAAACAPCACRDRCRSRTRGRTMRCRWRIT
jgi:hypothetical protein